MLLLLNARPGVGKLTIGRFLADRLGARLLDAHTLYNLAFATTEARSALFEETVRELRAIARARVLDLAPDVPVVLTDALFEDSSWANALWDDTLALAHERGGPFLVVLLECEREENERRLRSPERKAKRKPMDGGVLNPRRYERVPLSRGADALLRLDVTRMAPDDAAERIATWAAARAARTGERA